MPIWKINFCSMFLRLYYTYPRRPLSAAILQHSNLTLFFTHTHRLLLRHCFDQLRSTQVAVVHCSAQTSPMHVLQKLQQSCMVISSNTGRVYRPKDCERLVLYLKDLNLPKPDKWGTSQVIAFLQQVKLDLTIKRVLFYC